MGTQSLILYEHVGISKKIWIIKMVFTSKHVYVHKVEASGRGPDHSHALLGLKEVHVQEWPELKPFSVHLKEFSNFA